MKILVINSGSTSTKIAVFEDEKELFSTTIKHNINELKVFSNSIEQKDFRMEKILQVLTENSYNIEDFSSIGARGGILPPLKSGIYEINEKMVDYLANKTPVDHASNLAAVLAYDLTKKYNIPSFIADPVSVDEMDDVARYSGMPELPRLSLSHALNIKMVAKKVAEKYGKKYEDLNMVVAHLGGGISVTAHRKGRMIDVNGANDEGPFSPERTGEVPCGDLARLAFSGKYTYGELKKKLVKNGGVVAYLNTNNVKEAVEMMEKGDKKAKLVIDAMAYQISKEIMGMMTALKGNVDYTVITGGIAYNDYITDLIKSYVGKYAKFEVYPGENEMLALAIAAHKAVKKEIDIKKYN